MRHGLTRYKYGPDEHGAEGKGCRCGTCRDAATAYDRNRDRMIAYGRWQPFVPADRARQHAVWLRSAFGMGPGQIARLAGLSTAGVAALLDGRPGCQPTRRVRPETETAILAVRPTLDMLSPGTLVDPAGTCRRSQALAWRGWPFKTQGNLAGVGHLGEAIYQDHVSAACARAVRDLYDKLWNQDPPEGTTAEKRAASRARGKARREGWAAPGAWDDEPGPHCIDDPAATPVPRCERGEGRERRERGILAAEALDLLGFGLDLNQAAERLGVDRSTLTTTLSRIRAKEDDVAA